MRSCLGNSLATARNSTTSSYFRQLRLCPSLARNAVGQFLVGEVGRAVGVDQPVDELDGFDKPGGSIEEPAACVGAGIVADEFGFLVPAMVFSTLCTAAKT